VKRSARQASTFLKTIHANKSTGGNVRILDRNNAIEIAEANTVSRSRKTGC
jgi:hypothetical protein